MVRAQLDFLIYALTGNIDVINIPSVTIFGVIHRFDDGFTYGQSFWLTVCSTIFSTATNITLIYDYLRTEDFEHSGMPSHTARRAYTNNLSFRERSYS